MEANERELQHWGTLEGARLWAEGESMYGRIISEEEIRNLTKLSRHTATPDVARELQEDLVRDRYPAGPAVGQCASAAPRSAHDPERRGGVAVHRVADASGGAQGSAERRAVIATSGVAVWRLSLAKLRISSSLMMRPYIDSPSAQRRAPSRVPQCCNSRSFASTYSGPAPGVVEGSRGSAPQGPTTRWSEPARGCSGEEHVRCPALEHACKHGSFRSDRIQDDA